MDKEISLKTPKMPVESHKTEIFLLALFLILCIIMGILLWTNQNGNTDNTVNNVKVTATITTTATSTETPTLTPKVTVTPTVSPTLTPTAGPSVLETVTPALTTTPNVGGIAIYYAEPKSETDYDTISAVYRDVNLTGSAVYSYVISQFLSGPTTAEKSAGLTGTMTLSGSSTCGSSSFQFNILNGSITVKFCKTINYVQNSGTGGAFSGISLAGNKRIINALTQSLKAAGASTVIIKNADDSCFAKDTGLNQSCSD